MTKQQLIEQAATIGIEFKKSWTKAKMLSILTSSYNEATRIIDHHEHHSNSYFWTPPGNASGRRAEEKRKSFNISIGNYSYESDVRCSCKNYYYTGTFKENGKTKNLRCFRKLEKELDRIISNV